MCTYFQHGNLTSAWFVFIALEFERVFAVLAFVMAACAVILCLMFALCWTHETGNTYSNARSLLMVGSALYPTTLLLITLTLTGMYSLCLSLLVFVCVCVCF